jgi:Domain of unknown function (DUF4167)
MRSRNRNRNSGNGNSNGNKNGNLLNRSYESNGPGVKLRGNAQTIAEKYVQLARDAQSAGDYVGFESHMQHAEHYFRLITTAHEQIRLTNPNWRPEPLNTSGNLDHDDEDGENEGVATENQEQPEGGYRSEPQHQQPRQPREHREQRENRQPRENREPRENRNDRFNRPRYDVSGGGGDAANAEQPQPTEQSDEFAPRRNRFNRFDKRPRRFEPQDGAPQEAVGEVVAQPAPQPRPIERAPEVQQEQFALPSFLTAGIIQPASSEGEAPVKRPRARRTPAIETNVE